jgi:tetratricopeptide (TPR) repeat protein
MSEMLGNHYFLLGHYNRAIETYVKVFSTRIPSHILKKMVICHITQGNQSMAQEYFLKILNEDPMLIVDTANNDEDCPCPDLILKLENKFHPPSTKEEIISLGMLWLYCDIGKSREYFQTALNKYPEDKFIIKSLNAINQIKLKKRETI